MKRLVIIYSDGPEARELADAYRAAKASARLRNPAMFEAVEPCHMAIIPGDAPNATKIDAAYKAAGIAVKSAMKVHDFEKTMAADAATEPAKAQEPGDRPLPADWRALKPWTKKLQLAKQFNPNFEPDANDRVASIDAFLEEVEGRFQAG